MIDHPYALALEEARRGADRQWGDLSTLRGHAVSVLSVGGLSASFIGGLAIRDGAKMSWLTWGAVAAFILLCALCVGVLWPRSFRTTQDPVVLIGWVDSDKADTSHQERELARYMARQYGENAVVLGDLMKLYCMAIIALFAEVACLMFDLVGR